MGSSRAAEGAVGVDGGLEVTPLLPGACAHVWVEGFWFGWVSGRPDNSVMKYGGKFKDPKPDTRFGKVSMEIYLARQTGIVVNRSG